MRKRDDISKTQLVLTCLSLLLVTISSILFLTLQEIHGYPDSFRAQGTLLYGMTMVGQVTAWLIRRTRYSLFPISVQIVCSMVIGYPLGADVLTESILYSAILLNLTTIVQPLVAGPVAIMYIYLIGRYQFEVVAWQQIVPGPHVSYRIAVIGIAATISILGLAVTWHRNNRSDLRREISQLNETIDGLSKANVGFQEYAATVVGQSIDNERKRISRELHDTVGYALTNIRMMMEEAIGSYEGQSDEMMMLLAHTRNQAKETLNETRLTLRKLRQISEVQAETGLRAITGIVNAFRNATGIDVKLERANTRSSYGHTIDRFVYRFLQESLTNAFRHGQSKQIFIYLFEKQRELMVAVQDNGTGCNDVLEGVGIQGMRERLAELNGFLHFENSDYGFKIVATIPIPDSTKGNERANSAGR